MHKITQSESGDFSTRPSGTGPVGAQSPEGTAPSCRGRFPPRARSRKASVFSSEIDALRDAYLSAGIVGPGAQRDAEHIAAATVADADLIVSWNFKHIVHYEKISGYHGINLLHGYSAIRIFSPLEVV